MLASHAWLPPLHRYIHVNRNGSSNQNTAVNTCPDKRLVGSFDTRSLMSSRPSDAVNNRSGRFSYGCGNHTAHTNQNNGWPKSVKRPSPFMRTGEGCSTGTKGAVTTSSFSQCSTRCDM